MEARDPLLGEVLDGRYRIEEKIGTGGMGDVFRAVQLTVIDREVAIKMLNTSAVANAVVVRRFENEARIIAQLRHPNTLKLIDTGRTPDGRLYIVTELLRGEPLDRILGRGPISETLTAHIMSAVIDSLAEAHEAGVVHRDLKPGNIFLERVADQDIVKVLDFGIAKLLDRPGFTAPMAIFGTPAYMAPEQAQGGAVGPRSDFYSLGVIAYECLTGRPMFGVGSPFELLEKQIGQKPEPLSRLVDGNPQLANLIMRMLEKEVSKRPQTVAEIRGVLQAIELGLDEPGTRPGSPQTIPDDTPLGLAPISGSDLVERTTVDPTDRTQADRSGPTALVDRPDRSGPTAVIDRPDRSGPTAVVDRSASRSPARPRESLSGPAVPDPAATLERSLVPPLGPQTLIIDHGRRGDSLAQGFEAPRRPTWLFAVLVALLVVAVAVIFGPALARRGSSPVEAPLPNVAPVVVPTPTPTALTIPTPAPNPPTTPTTPTPPVAPVAPVAPTAPAQSPGPRKSTPHPHSTKPVVPPTEAAPIKPPPEFQPGPTL